MNYKIDDIISLKGYDKHGREIISFVHPKVCNITTSYDTKEVKGKYNETLMLYDTKTINVDFSCSDIELTYYEDEKPEIDLKPLAGNIGVASDEGIYALNGVADAIDSICDTTTSAYDSIKELTHAVSKLIEKQKENEVTGPTMEKITEKPNQKSDLEFFEPILPKFEFTDFDDMDFDFKI